ncbi:unnamed protein product [Lampetra fluviatilis]
MRLINRLSAPLDQPDDDYTSQRRAHPTRLLCCLPATAGHVEEEERRGAPGGGGDALPRTAARDHRRSSSLGTGDVSPTSPRDATRKTPAACGS